MGLTFLKLYAGDLGKLEQQWRVLDMLPWQNTEGVKTKQFWIEVKNHVDATGERDFAELGSFALSLLALPFSNAAVERTFSEINFINNKLCNRMTEGLLLNILRIRAFFQRHEI